MVTPKRRSTIDIVVIMLTAMIGLVLLITIGGIILLKFMRPEVNTEEAGGAVRDIVTTVVGALVGFIGGRAQGRWEGLNGKTD